MRNKKEILRLGHELLDKKSSKRITVRLTDYEYQKVNQLSKAARVNKSDFVRHCLAHPFQKYRPAPKPAFTKKDYQAVDIMNDTRIQLARAGNLLNQVVANANQGNLVLPNEYMGYVKSIQHEVGITKDALREMNSRE